MISQTDIDAFSDDQFGILQDEALLPGRAPWLLLATVVRSWTAISVIAWRMALTPWTRSP